MSGACCTRIRFCSSTVSSHPVRNFTTVVQTGKNRKLLSHYPVYRGIAIGSNLICTGERSWRSNVENQRKFFDWIASRLEFKTLDDWYKLKSKDILEHGGKGVLSQYKGSIFEALSTIYPSHTWIPWKFEKVPNGFWKDVENHKKYFAWLAQQLEQGIQQLDDWYNVRLKDVIKYRGAGIISEMYGNSLMMALQKVYPDHNWCGWKFTRNSPRGYWNSESRTKLMKEISEKLSISTLEDWYRVSNKQLIEFGAGFLIKKYGIFKLLKEAYPDYPWDIQRLTKVSGRKRAAQRWLCVQISNLFPQVQVIEEFTHAGMKFPGTNRIVQLDVFLPEYNLAFEYQGEQHYQELHYFSPVRHYSERDEAKQALCKSANITLITVPFWWNKQPESLGATVLKARPDLSKHLAASHLQRASNAAPIEETPNIPLNTTPHRRKTTISPIL